MKRWISSLLTVTCALFIAGCGAQKDPNHIVVGTEATFPPFEYRADNGEITGFDIDLIKAIGEDQGLTVEIQHLGFDSLIPALQTGSIDVAASGMSITPERQNSVLFSDAYINAGLSVTVRANETRVKDIQNLKEFTAAVQIGSTGAATATKMKEAGLLKSVLTLENVALAMEELNKGGVDLVINDGPVSEAYVARKDGKLKVMPGYLVSDDYGLAMRKGNEKLAAKINAGLTNIKANGKFDEIKAKYFGK